MLMYTFLMKGNQIIKQTAFTWHTLVLLDIPKMLCTNNHAVGLLSVFWCLRVTHSDPNCWSTHQKSLG